MPLEGPNPTSTLRHWMSLALAGCGVAVLTYVGFQYTTMYLGQRRLARQWDAQQKHPALYREVTTRGLTRISSPKIGLDAIVVEGTDSDSLALGPGHMEHTAFAGQPGNVVITAHRDTFFRHLNALEKGDTLMVQRDGKTYIYEVTGRTIVDPSDVSVIQPTSDAELTLITCYPTYYIGPAPERLVIFSKLVGDSTAPSLAEQTDAPATKLHRKLKHTIRLR